MSFDTALQVVHDSLAQLKDRGVELRASSAALERLVKTKTSSSGTGQAAESEPRISTDETRIEQKPAPPVRENPRPAVTASTSPAEVAAKAARLAELRPPVLACTKCPHLVASRTQVVFGVGNPAAELMFVGEAPGADEDRQGEPFVGKAGQLLTKIIVAMGYTREDVYIANVLKCRPDTKPGESGNRKPTPAEMNTCKPYLLQQIEIIQPKVIVALGGTAVEGLLGMEKAGITKLRGTWKEFHGTPLMPTFHPSFLLRPTSEQLANKRLVWEDMLLVLDRLGQPISEKQRGYFLPK